MATALQRQRGGNRKLMVEPKVNQWLFSALISKEASDISMRVMKLI
jgi:hypothetical protein